jgi:hypothetical protein
MPIIVDQPSGTEHEVTQAEYKQRKRMVESDQLTHVIQVTGEKRKERCLWDCAEGAWTKPIPESAIVSFHLRKVVYKCSECIFVTAFDGGVAAHVRSGLERAQEHEGAQLEVTVGMSGGQHCSGCGIVFSMRKGQARKHLEAMQVFPSAHQEVHELTIKKFALEPSELVVLQKVLVHTNGHQQDAGLDASRVVGSVAPRPRGRRRRRNRGR